MFVLEFGRKNGRSLMSAASLNPESRALDNQYLTTARAANGFSWEDALIRAEIGIDLNNLKWGKPLASCVGHHGIMATRNGVVRGYTIAPEFEKHVFKKIDILKPGEAINDYMNERVGYLYYQFDNLDEIISTVSHINDLIHIEFED